MLVLIKLSPRKFKLINTNMPGWHCERKDGLGYEMITSPEVLVESGSRDDCMTAARQFVNARGLRLTSAEWSAKYGLKQE